MRRSFFICAHFLFLYSFFLPAQTVTKIDKLRSNINTAVGQHQKLEAALAFCDEWESYNPDTLKKYANFAKGLAAVQKDTHSELLADYYLAVYLFQVNKLDTALSTIKNVITRYKTSFPYDKYYGKMYALKGNILLRTADMDELMSNDFELIKLSEQHKDTLGMARGTLGIGNVNLKLKKYDEALVWDHRALELMHNPFYKRKLSFIYNNISIIFYHLAKEDSAIYYVKEGINYSRQDENLTNLANSLFLYGGLLAEFKHLKEAEESFKEAVEVRKKIGDVYYLIADMGQLALFYADNKNTEKGIALSKEALALAEKSGLDYNSLNTIYESLAKNYLVSEDYKNYGETVVKQMALKDSLYKKNSAEAMAEIQTKYDLQKKENTIIQQKLDLTKKNYLFYGLLCLTIFALFTSYTIFRTYRRKQKMKLQLMRSEEKQLATLAVTKAEEAERKRIAADLHDNLGVYAASIVSNIDNISLTRNSTENPAALEELRRNSQSIVSQLNDTIWVLKKDALLLTAISDRIKIFIQRIQSSYPFIRIDVLEKITNDHLLPPSQAFHLFQIIKEGINNALKHSYCKQIYIIVEGSALWKIIITDDGKGLNKDELIREEGNGLVNMRSRSRESGWNITWTSNEPQGTQVTIEPTTN